MPRRANHSPRCELLREYGVEYAVGLPVVVAVVAAVVGFILAPGGLEANATHEHYVGFFSSAAQVIGTLLVALVVEVRFPFSRTTGHYARAAGASATVVIALGGLAAILGLSPGLPQCLYRITFAMAWGGLVGGLVAVTAIGVNLVLATLRQAKREKLEGLRELGDKTAAEDLARLYDDWGTGPQS
jgi:hypothetical protein